MRGPYAYARLIAFTVLATAACGGSAAPPAKASPPRAPAAGVASTPPTSSAARPARSATALRAPTDSEVFAIREALASRINECFVAWVGTQPTAPAHCAFDLAYDAEGVLSALSVAPLDGSEHPAPEQTITCLRTAIASTRVPAPKAAIALRLPFELNPPPPKPAVPKTRAGESADRRDKRQRER